MDVIQPVTLDEWREFAMKNIRIAAQAAADAVAAENILKDVQRELDVVRAIQSAPASDIEAGLRKIVNAQRNRLRKTLQEKEEFGHRIRGVLTKHWLMDIGCSHQDHTDTPQCACCDVQLGTFLTVGDAVDAWVDHVMHEVAL